MTELKTASSVVNYIVALESASAGFYRRAAGRFHDMQTVLEKLAKENEKYGKRIKKAYYSAVTDALETNFSFKGLNAAVALPEAAAGESKEQLRLQSVALERDIQAFYLDAAGQSQGLLADVPKAIARLAKERDKRIKVLEKALHPQ